MKDDCGPELSSLTIIEYLSKIFKKNLLLETQGYRGLTVCLWGSHGIGKTEIVRDYANSRGWQFCECSPAQFEEMNDFHGLPANSDKASTIFNPPDWVPRKEGPGIFLLDDINRADDRILRGLMPLLQNHELFSWSLPPKWHLVATANPDKAEYSVTPLDIAMRSRMLDISLAFDPRSWAVWAGKQGLDRRCMDFVLAYPELVNEGKTSPRSLVKFFRMIEDYHDFSSNLTEISHFGRMCIDEAAVEAFIAFAKDGMHNDIDLELFLTGTSTGAMLSRIEEMVYEAGITRCDKLSVFMDRIYVSLLTDLVPFSRIQGKNLVSLLMADFFPADLRISFWKDIAACGRSEIKTLLSDHRLTQTIIQN